MEYKMLSPFTSFIRKTIITKIRYVDFSDRNFTLNAHFGKSIMDNNHNYFLLVIFAGSLCLLVAHIHLHMLTFSFMMVSGHRFIAVFLSLLSLHWADDWSNEHFTTVSQSIYIHFTSTFRLFYLCPEIRIYNEQELTSKSYHFWERSLIVIISK